MTTIRTKRIARMNNQANPYGANRNARRSDVAFTRKDQRNQLPSTDFIMKSVKVAGKALKQVRSVKVNLPAIQTKGAFGKCSY